MDQFLTWSGLQNQGRMWMWMWMLLLVNDSVDVKRYVLADDSIGNLAPCDPYRSIDFGTDVIVATPIENGYGVL
jgi:hypothetical protein